MKPLKFHVDINVLNQKSVQEFANKLSGTRVAWPEAVGAAIFNPANDPATRGYEVVGRTTKNLTRDEDAYRVSFEVVVNDPAAVVAEAVSQYFENWMDENWRPSSLEEALFEILVHSNDSPSPGDVGLEIEDPDLGSAPTPVPEFGTQSTAA